MAQATQFERPRALNRASAPSMDLIQSVAESDAKWDRPSRSFFNRVLGTASSGVVEQRSLACFQPHTRASVSHPTSLCAGYRVPHHCIGSVHWLSSVVRTDIRAQSKLGSEWGRPKQRFGEERLTHLAAHARRVVVLSFSLQEISPISTCCSGILERLEIAIIHGQTYISFVKTGLYHGTVSNIRRK